MKILRSIASLFCMMGTLVAVAQISVEQRIDSVGILIGQQAHLSVKVTALTAYNTRCRDLRSLKCRYC